MQQLTPDQALQAGLQHHQAGRLAKAEAIYRKVLAQQPNHPEALHLLGVLARHVGRNDASVELIGRALGIKPDEPTYLANLSVTFRNLGRLDDAIAACRRAIAVKPDHSLAHMSLGVTLFSQGQFEQALGMFQALQKIQPNSSDAHDGIGCVMKVMGKLDEAVAAHRKAITLKYDFPEAYNNLGLALMEQGKTGEAIDAYHNALRFKPRMPEAHGNLGLALMSQRKLAEAIAAFQETIAINENIAEVHANLGAALMGLGKLEEAAAACSRAIALKGNYAEGYNNLGNVLKTQGKLDEAIAAYSRAVELKPALAPACNNLSTVYMCQGRLDDALAWSDKSIALNPADARLHSARVMTMHFHPAYDSAAILREQLEWSHRHGRTSAGIVGHDHKSRRTLSSSTANRLRVGYVSPDFREHVIGRNMLPLFREHDHKGFEVFCYSDVERSDAITEKFRSYADVWRDILGLSHDLVAEQIRSDGIDILVDLTMHLVGSRLPVFVRRPAPVQVAFGAYPGGTGLSAMDYRLTDPYLDPPAVSDSDYVEKSIRLPDSFWCYDPQSMNVGDVEPEIGPLPARQNGFITFGCLNNFSKVNDGILSLWSSVLNAVKDSRLILLAPQGSHRRLLVDRLGERDIRPERVEFVPILPRGKYLETYQRIDIGLDTIPYNGHTTSLDSYWMGVPVVTLVGRTVVGRAGLSQSGNLGLQELVARTPEQYVQIARELASDVSRLAELRSGLRQRMLRSPLTDAMRFARNIEQAYRQMWE